MPSLGDFKKGDEVFILESPEDCLGVEIVESPEGKDTTFVRIVHTNGIPGYELGQEIRVAVDIIACKKITVSTLVAMRLKQQYGDPTPCDNTAPHRVHLHPSSSALEDDVQYCNGVEKPAAPKEPVLPGKLVGLPVYASCRDPKPGPTHRWHVLCTDGTQPQPFVVWDVKWNVRTREFDAYNGHYCETLARAFEVFAERTGITAPPAGSRES